MIQLIRTFEENHNFSNEPFKLKEKKRYKAPQDTRMIIQLEIQKSFFERIIKNIPAAIAIFDKDLNYIVTSNRWTEQTSLNPQLIVGRNMYDVVPDLPKKWKEIHRRGLQGERLKANADTWKRADGSTEWFRWEVLPWYEDENSIGGIILFVEHITQAKILKKKMQQMIKALNISNSELERFAHICAHDLNEPLRTISNYTQILQSELGEQLDDEPKLYLQNIIKNVRHMSDLVNGVLTYSQFGLQTLRVSAFSLSSLVDRVKASLEEIIREKNACIQIHSQLPQLHGDMNLITRVIQNIVSNSLKFNEEHAPSIEVSVCEKPKFWIISFQDNGIGVDPKFHKSIFRIFNRLHPTNQYPGTGMGLCICKKIIEAHGGKIWVESPAHNKGAIFSFSLPKKAEKKGEARGPTQDSLITKT